MTIVQKQSWPSLNARQMKLLSRSACFVLMAKFASLVDRSAATISLTELFESMRITLFGSARELRGESNKLESMNQMMTMESILGRENRRQKSFQHRKDNEMIYCHDMPPKSESLPIYGFNFGFISAI